MGGQRDDTEWPSSTSQLTQLTFFGAHYADAYDKYSIPHLSRASECSKSVTTLLITAEIAYFEPSALPIGVLELLGIPKKEEMWEVYAAMLQLKAMQVYVIMPNPEESVISGPLALARIDEAAQEACLMAPGSSHTLGVVFCHPLSDVGRRPHGWARLAFSFQR